jgi:anaerobic selenocysteine-containing dehydrogenase
MKTGRRNFLLLGSGAVAGTALTPAPWKLLDDVSIWSQNWSWIPRPLAGAIHTRYTACTLCPAACGVRARCVGDQPIGLAGVQEHPISQGKLCTVGLGAHQLPYHPQRTRGSAEALKTLAARLSANPRTVLLDLAPGRAASAIYSRLDGITYATVSGELAGTERLGLDISRVRTVVSFGAPVLEMWGSVLAAWSGDSRPRIIQIESSLSRTASLADRWIAVLPGTAAVLAKALRGELTVSAAAQQCGISVGDVEELAGTIASGAAMVLSLGQFPRADEQVIASLNSGSAAVVRRAASPIAPVHSTPLDAIEDGSVELLLIDHGPVASSPGWDLISRKLARKGFVVSFSPYDAGDVLRANLVVPTAAWLEASDDAVQPPNAPVPTYTIAPALLPPRTGTVDPADVLSGASGVRESELRARVRAIHEANKGELFAFADASRTSISDIESAGLLWEKFQQGAVWIGEAATGAPALPIHAACTLAAAPLLPAAGVLPPLTCKLTQESRLYRRNA